jgi:hypothetical protein
MSVKTILQQPDRCTLMATDMSRTIKISRAADASVSRLNEEYISSRGRRREPTAISNDQLHQNSSQQLRRFITPDHGINKSSNSIPTPRISRPTFATPPTERRASPDSRGRRAATPHPRKAMLPRCGSPKILQQPALSFRAGGHAGFAECTWDHEDYKHLLHLNWLNRE